jgi:phosphoribosylaminoimidazolecarboxamide formyltransferase/IMP cyclohydrolase
MEELAAHGLQEIGLVAVNLYPFAKTVGKAGVTQEEAVEQIDVGGPTMIRAAAKNFASVVVLCDPADYPAVINEWRKHGDLSMATRKRLAAKAFAHVSEYDRLIAGYLGAESSALPSTLQGHLPGKLTLNLTRVQNLRYGENPHQMAALYRDDLPVPGATLVGSIQQLSGRELSYNNMLDADAALSLARDYVMPCVAIIKHAGPCGIACGANDADLPDIFARALASDPQSAFGGIVGVNRPVDLKLADQVAKTRFDIMVAPAFSPDAVEMLAARKNLRLLAVPDSDVDKRDADFAAQWEFRQLSGGFLLQNRDMVDLQPHMEPVTLRRPTLDEITDMIFAWRAVRHVKSNAIVLVKGLATVGIGGGQPSRVDSVEIAVKKAGAKARGAVLASDAFFPFPDGLEKAAAAGVTAIIQPGGSVNDDAVIEAADNAGVAMVFTGKRHFKH